MEKQGFSPTAMFCNLFVGICVTIIVDYILLFTTTILLFWACVVKELCLSSSWEEGRERLKEGEYICLVFVC